MKMIRILLADDHKIVVEGLRSLLPEDFELVGTAANGHELLELAAQTRPDVAVVDISMPLLNGIEATAKLKELQPELKVVILTMHPDRVYATRALASGASAYVLKHSAPDELVTAIREVLLGNVYVSESLRGAALTELMDEQKRHVKTTLELTARQKEVLQLLAEGKSAKEIGALLEISPRTVETHKYKMMDDLGVKTSAQLVQWAIKHGVAST